MKKLLLSFIIALMIGCGDDVTNINGYTDEQVQAKIDSTLANMESETITINDTIYQMTVDTVYKMVIDTVKEQMYDTLYKQVIDTVTNELVDTIYQRVIDTVYNELIDTIYQHVIDTVFKEIAVEVPRDTTITLYDTTDGNVTAKIYSGVVYHNTFYETKLHQFATYRKTSNTSLADAILTILDSTKSLNCMNAMGVSSWMGNCPDVYMKNECGTLTEHWNSTPYYLTTQITRLKGMHIATIKEMDEIKNHVNLLVSDSISVKSYGVSNPVIQETRIYLSKVGNSFNYMDGYGNILSTNVNPNVYMCAYDLDN